MRLRPTARAACCILFTLLTGSGCTMTPRQYWDSLKGEGFPDWNETLGTGVRGSTTARPSGFFTDRRSEQIEQRLGGF